VSQPILERFVRRLGLFCSAKDKDNSTRGVDFSPRHAQASIHRTFESSGNICLFEGLPAGHGSNGLPLIDAKHPPQRCADHSNGFAHPYSWNIAPLGCGVGCVAPDPQCAARNLYADR
jgi:hypothetical protein